MIRQILKLLLFITTPIFGNTQSNNDTPLKIQFNSVSYIQLTLVDVDTPFDLNWAYHPQLSKNRISTPTYQINHDTTLTIPITIHMPQKESFRIQKMEFPVFLTIDDTIGVNVNVSSKKIIYSMNNVAINRYYSSVHQKLGDIWGKYVSLFREENRPWEDIHGDMDALAIATKNLIYDTKIDLPEWFTTLEIKKAEFHNAHYKLSAPKYRNFTSSDKSKIPNADLYNFAKKLDLKSPYNKYLRSFYMFMNFYASYKVYGEYYILTDSTSQLYEDPSLSTLMFEVFEDELESDNLLAYATHNTYPDILKNSIRKTARLDYLRHKHGENNRFVKQLLAEEAKMPDLRIKKGDDAPGFYLADGLGQFHTLEEQRGNVVLLNFYIRGCKPCIRAIPYEKKLLKEYKNKGFNIVNICVTRSKEQFQKANEEFNMEGLNLYTQGNWSKNLIKKYGIAGYPHYALVDAEGKLIMNHAFKPENAELEKLIRSALEK